MNSSRARAALVAIALAGSLGSAIACNENTVTRSTVVSGVTLTPSTVSLLIGNSRSLSADVKNDAGETVEGAPVFWSTSDSTIATVSETGVVTARRAGQASIAATSLGMSAVANVVVNTITLPNIPPTPAAVATVAVSVGGGALKVGQTRQATAQLRSASGATLTGRTITWRSADDRIATVSSSGMITAKKAGSVSITATSEGKSGAATLTVQK